MEKSAALVDEPHIKYVCDWMQAILERVEQDEPQPLALGNIPPGSGKSTMATALCAWAFVRNKGFKILYCSHNSDLAKKNSMIVRDILKSDTFRELYPDAFRFRRDADGVMSFKAENGSLFKIASTQKSPIGNHFNLIVVDDPVDPADALSKAKSTTAANFVNQALPSRGLGNFATLMIMQRLSDIDPAGTWLELHGEDKLNWLCLPAEKSARIRPVEAERIYSADGLLAPIRLNQDKLLKMRRSLVNSYSGQYEQHPTPVEGGLLKRAWFSVITQQEFNTLTAGQHVVFNFDIDTAYTADAKNDPSALLCSAFVEDVLYIKDVREEWLEAPQLMKLIEAFVAENLEGVATRAESMAYVEPKASGKTIVQMMRKETTIKICEAVAPTREKVVRVNGISSFCANRQVVLISDVLQRNKWNQKFLEQITTVPYASHWDMTDVLVQAVERALTPVVKKKGFRLY
ncbi:hypothetical protein [Hymenobacter canadensis]|uniref:Terminase large subunit gp17-like C-terminal domain-containing protein n=1 Tax=Hymenobacter canadensis TaxID=2999067 RepID=A0ABY7LUH8_9BACT|nr:hypothetical protein [Hymenobacter canadensis]WBA43156.1 hypothetical protein O3303_06225 [Hymenobacter canadensis]